MSESIELPKTYEDGLKDGIKEGLKLARETLKRKGVSSNLVCSNLPETEAIKILKEQIEKMKCCYNCKHYEDYDFKKDCIKNTKCNSYDKWELK